MMNEKEFLENIVLLAATRSYELSIKANSDICQGSAARWIHGLAETNKEWAVKAQARLLEIKAYEQTVARVELAAKTFRGNDDDQY